MSRTIRVGSRESVLAVRQAGIVMEAIRRAEPGARTELIKIKTTGDKILDRNLDEIGGKGLFIKELEQALADGRIDIAVHSYKDMPHEETEGLPIVALSERESPFDVLVLPEGISEPDVTKPVGSSSLRRTIQFKKLYEGYEVKSIRGNVPTRLSKLDNGEYSALIVAEAGLNRLALRSRISRVFTLDEMIPAASQGIIAVQGREGGDHSYLDGFHSIKSEVVSKAERQFLKTLDGGCSSPVAVYGQLQGNTLKLTGMYVDPAGNIETGTAAGDPESAGALGDSLAKQLKARSLNR